jgi:hypothetical protein
VEYVPSETFKQAQRKEDGAGAQVPANAVPRIEGTPDLSSPTGFNNSAPIMVWRTPDGKQVDAKPLTADQRTQWEKDQAGRQTAQPTTRQGAVPGYPGWIAQTTKDAQGNEVEVYVDPQGAVHRALPAKPEAPAQPQAGKPYKNAQGQWVQPIADANGNITGTRPVPPEAIPPEDAKSGEKAGAPYKNAAGQWVQPISDANGRVIRAEPLAPGMAPAEPQRNLQTVVRDGQLYEVVPGVNGAAPTLREIKEQGAKPKSPTQYRPTQIIVGAAQDGLRQSYDDIQAEVDSGRQTPAWGENRRKEVFETAQLTVNEAHLHEQSRQFNQSLSYNVANSRMQNQQGVLEFALRSALSINGKIKKGSSAGAELFRGLFNLGMRMQADSGINDIRPGGGQSSIPGAPGARGAPGQPARAGSPTTRPPMDIGDAKALAAHADQEAANIQAGLEASGAPRERTPVADPTLPLPVRNGVPVTSTPAVPSPPVADPAPAVPAAPPAAVPVPTAPPPPQAMTPPEPQFAAMEALRMKQPQVDPLAAPQMDPMQGVGEMPAALTHTQIAATPPWLLDPDQLPDLVRQYGEDAVFGYPGMPRSEVMA